MMVLNSGLKWQGQKTCLVSAVWSDLGSIIHFRMEGDGYREICVSKPDIM